MTSRTVAASPPRRARFDVPMAKGSEPDPGQVRQPGGAWQFSVAVSGDSELAFLKGPAPGAFDPETYRSFAMKAKGKADHGKALFNDLKGLACIKCHVVGGAGGDGRAGAGERRGQVSEGRADPVGALSLLQDLLGI